MNVIRLSHAKKSVLQNSMSAVAFWTSVGCLVTACQAGEPSLAGRNSTTVQQTTTTTRYVPLQGDRDLKKFVQEISSRLDALEKDVEEWGHGSMSGLELIPLESGKDFEPLTMGENRTYKEILTDVNQSVQGGASLFDQSSLTVGIAGRGNVDQVAKPSQELFQSQNSIARDRMETARKEEKEVAKLLQQQRVETERQKLEKLREAAAQEAVPSEGAASEGAAPAASSESALPAGESGASNSLFATPVSSLPDGTADVKAPRETRDFDKDDLFDGRLLNSPLQGADGKSLPFSTFQQLNNTQVPTRSISPAEASAQAKSIGIQERITDLIANPVSIDGKRALYMAIAQVSVSPGWRTKEGYACEVSLRAELVKSADDVSGVEQVSIFGMFPQARAQTLDLAYSKRWQFQLLMNLAAQYAAAGQEASGRAVIDYVKRLEKDVDTRSSLPVLVPTSDGTQVTYRFDPSLQALADPSANRTKPANILHATSVPVLLAMSCEKTDIKNFPKVRLRMTSRWLPLEKRHWAKKYAFDWWYYAYSRDGRHSEKDTFNNALKLDEATRLMYQYAEAIKGADSVTKAWNNSLKNAVVARFRLLEPTVSGNIITRSMPEPKVAKVEEKDPPAPIIVNVSPGSVKEGDAKLAVSIRIQNFGDIPDGTKLRAFLGGEAVDATVEGKGVLTAKFDFAGTLPPGDVDLIVARPDAEISAATKFKVIPEKPAPAPAAEIKGEDISFIPETGHLFATTSIFVKGKAFQTSDGKPGVKSANFAGRECIIEVISPTLLKLSVPPWMEKPLAGSPAPDSITEPVLLTDGKNIVVSTNKVTFKATNISDPKPPSDDSDK